MRRKRPGRTSQRMMLNAGWPARRESTDECMLARAHRIHAPRVSGASACSDGVWVGSSLWSLLDPQRCEDDDPLRRAKRACPYERTPFPCGDVFSPQLHSPHRTSLTPPSLSNVQGGMGEGVCLPERHGVVLLLDAAHLLHHVVQRVHDEQHGRLAARGRGADAQPHLRKKGYLRLRGCFEVV
jgi:hypothetical protein